MHAREIVRGVHQRPGYAFSDTELLKSLRALHALAATVEAAKLALVAELDVRPEAVPGARRSAVAVTFLTEGLNQSRAQATRDVAAATALASANPELPLLAQALADGEISREHADVAVSTLRRLPKTVKTRICEDPGGARRTGTQVIDELLTNQARQLPPTTVERLGKQIIDRLDPDRAERFNPATFQQRTCTTSTDFAGMGLYRLILDPVTHLHVSAAIARFSAPRPATTALTEDGELIRLTDERTPGQRRADAITDLILTGAAAQPGGEPRTQPGTGPRTQPAAESQATSSGEPASGEPRAADTGTEPGAAPDHGPGAQPGTGPGAEPGTEPAKAQPLVPGAAGGPEQPAPPSITGGVLMTPLCAGVEIGVTATLDQFAAALGARDPAALTAGLARLGLAGNIGTYPGATLDPQVLARLACDSPIRRILTDHHGAVLHYGRTQRLATPHQRRALAVRDGGCIVPGCPAPPEWCQAHHITPWEHGGSTNLDSMALLCSRHHTAHHAGIYAIEMRHGIPWVRLPHWQHPQQPWMRNLSHEHHHLANTTAATINGDINLNGGRTLPPTFLPPTHPRATIRSTTDDIATNIAGDAR